MKKPFLYALVAAVYIIFIVLVMQTASSFLPPKDNLLMPITMLGLFVLSAAVMGFLFLSEPLRLFLENQKQEAFIFFTKTIGVFACFVVIFAILVFLI
ncbi:MAG: hypothetical protein AAB681_00270 [Patescibacteria group bacterium]